VVSVVAECAEPWSRRLSARCRQLSPTAAVVLVGLGILAAYVLLEGGGVGCCHTAPATAGGLPSTGVGAPDGHSHLPPIPPVLAAGQRAPPLPGSRPCRGLGRPRMRAGGEHMQGRS
jgi:hypothetical protein